MWGTTTDKSWGEKNNKKKLEYNNSAPCLLLAGSDTCSQREVGCLWRDQRLLLAFFFLGHISCFQCLSRYHYFLFFPYFFFVCANCLNPVALSRRFRVAFRSVMLAGSPFFFFGWPFVLYVYLYILTNACWYFLFVFRVCVCLRCYLSFLFSIRQGGFDTNACRNQAFHSLSPSLLQTATVCLFGDFFSCSTLLFLLCCTCSLLFFFTRGVVSSLHS